MVTVRHHIFRFRRMLRTILQKSRNVMVWGLLTAVLIGVSDFGAPLEDSFQAARNKARSHDASGEVVVVGIDTLAVEGIGDWPWSNGQLATLVSSLDEAGAKRIFFEFPTQADRSDSENEAFVKALASSKAKVFLNGRFEIDPVTGQRDDILPPPEFSQHAGLINTNSPITGYNSIRDMPYGVLVSDIPVQSIASKISGVTGDVGSTFPVDYSVSTYTLPYVSASDVIAGTGDVNKVRGKDIIIGTNGVEQEQKYWIIGSGPSSGVFISALGAETLLHGQPYNMGWVAPLLAIALLVIGIQKTTRTVVRRTAKVTGLAVILTGPIFLEALNIFLQIMPALTFFGLAMIAGLYQRYSQSYKLRGTRNELSGLPNLNALRESSLPDEYLLVAARIQNFVEVATALPANSEKDFVKQIASRLSFGTSGETLYQGDEGIFFWSLPAAQKDDLTDQLSALQAIFRNPVPVQERKYDLDICFGIDVDTERSLSSRISSALLAAQGAHESSEQWKFYDPSDQQATAWKLSMLGELDDAIENGQLWVAFQPKLDIRNQRICGAEALVRWTHPEHGDISPEDFVLAAEKHNRIGRLTEFVLGKALDTAEQFSALGLDIKIAVNLSPRLLDQQGLAKMIGRAFVGREVDKSQLILEVTETAAMSSSETALKQLHDIKALGVAISIDDYGTGFSTLDYLRKCPASEVKIDRSFVQMLAQSSSDRIMVNSTIELAHSLGQKVVAEGVEDTQTLQQLTEMGCDIAQGYLIGRPMQLDALRDFLANYKKRNAA